MKASGALLLFLFCLCEAGTDVHFEVSIDHHENPHPENPHPENPHPENPHPMTTTTANPYGAGGPYSISILVVNTITNAPNLTFSAEVPYRAVLIGAMKEIQMNNNGFNFTTTEHQFYGAFLDSVNGVAGNATEHTYWQLQAKTKGGKIITPDVGISCYIPKPNQQVYLKFTKW